MNTTTRRILAMLAPAGLAAGLLLGCHSGTPAAPDGTEIHVVCEFLNRDFVTGNFEAVIHATVIDEESDVPQVGVGVYFRVRSGPGEVDDEGPVRTDNDGRAQAVLIGRGAFVGDEVTVNVSSGPATADIELDVGGCFSPDVVAPVADATVSPTSGVGVGDTVTLDFSDSTDSDCPGGKPESWTIDWGDGETDNGDFADDEEFEHEYTAQGTYDIEIEVEDCQGLTDTDTVRITVGP